MTTRTNNQQFCFPLDILPYHVQVNIFSWLPVADLNHVSELNSYYHEIVTSNPSLCSKFCLTITRHKLQRPKATKLSSILSNLMLKKRSHSQAVNTILKCNRKFESIKLKRSEIYEYEEISSPEAEASAVEIFRKHNSKIKWFQVTKEFISLDFFALLLHQLPNLECLEFLVDSIESPYFSGTAPVLKNLASLKVHSINHRDVGNFLKVFEKVDSLESLTLVEVLIPLYGDLLKRQIKLKELVIIGSFEGFLDDTIKIPFKLKKFVYVAYSSNSVDSLAKLGRFLNNQTELETLKLNGFPFYNKIFIQTLLSMAKLKELDLNLRDGLSTSIVLSVKNINEVGLSDLHISKKIVEYFPNVRCLELKFKESSNKLYHLSKLQKVSLIANNEYFQLLLANGFKTANLMEFRATIEKGSAEEWITFFHNNASITSIELCDYKFDDDVLEFIAGNLTQLERFVCHELVNESTIYILMCNCENLKTLQLYLEGTELEYARVFEEFEDKLETISCTWHFSRRTFIY